MTLLAILAATLAGGLLSVLAAAVLTFAVLRAWVPRLVAFAVGTLLGVALLDLLPHALEGGLDAHALFATLLAGLIGFFVLERLALWRHAHPTLGDALAPAAKHPAGVMVLVGDGVHNFVDGILIAAAFLADPWLGVTTAVAVLAHEIPQEVGDFLVLVESGYSRREAIAWNAVVSLLGVVGGVLGYVMLSAMLPLVPYALVLSAASFLYIAIADLVPMLHRAAKAHGGFAQLPLMLAGVGIAFVQAHVAH